MPGPNSDLLQLIHESWDTVRSRLQRDPAELERRLLHRARAAAAHPPRAWCLAVPPWFWLARGQDGPTPPRPAKDQEPPRLGRLLVVLL